MNDDLFSAVAFIVLLAIVCVGGVQCIRVDCAAKWRDSGSESRYAVLGGCQIKLPDGRWVPEERFINMREAK